MTGVAVATSRSTCTGTTPISSSRTSTSSWSAARSPRSSAALHYWFPKMFGRLYSERWGLLGRGLVFVGFILTFFPQFLLGNMGMPRRYYSYPRAVPVLNVLSTGGAYLLGAAHRCSRSAYLIVALAMGPRAPAQPLGLARLRVADASPPPKHNFDCRSTSRSACYAATTVEEAHVRTRLAERQHASSAARHVGCLSRQRVAAVRGPARAVRGVPRRRIRSTFHAAAEHANVAHRHDQHRTSCSRRA